MEEGADYEAWGAYRVAKKQGGEKGGGGNERKSKGRAKGDGQTLNGFIDISELLIAASNVAASTVWRQAASYGEIPGMSLRNTPGI